MNRKVAMKLQPLYIVPLLVEQPTWGGQYIAQFKQLDQRPDLPLDINQPKIGQAFELARDSVLTRDHPETLPFLFAEATNLDHPQWIGSSVDTISMQDLIDEDPRAVLGSKALEVMGAQMQVLNKFTQARQNSFQVHVKPGREFDGWQPKPESWYYFEPGKATLGLAPDVDLDAYRRRCEEIDQRSQQLSTLINRGELNVESARQQLSEFINEDHPRNYVNTVRIDKNQVVDLSSGGIHHSWEIDAQLPQGNIVYEVQLDQRDEVSSIRSFDQGKIKDNGSVRPIHIDSYFQALNTEPVANTPQQYMETSTSYSQDEATITELFASSYYHLIQLKFTHSYFGSATQLDEEFHHIFVKEGNVTLEWQNQEWYLPQGWSLFIPASCKEYRLRVENQHNQKGNQTDTAVILRTTA